MVTEPLSRNTLRRMQELVRTFGKQQILVIGDMVLDQFVYGVSSRISREAPVLILRHARTENAPGGAGNAAANLHALGARVLPVGVLGNDGNGQSLRQILEERGIGCQGLFDVPGARTTTKSRIMGGLPHSPAQQIVRLDHEFDAEAAQAREPEIRQYLSQHLPDCSGVVISDYGYGAVSRAVRDLVIRTASRNKIPVVVDSRFRLPWFRGVTALTPNITEVEEACHCRLDNQLDELRKKAAEIMARQKLQALLVTRGKYGMILYEASGAEWNIPVFGTDQVADVTGAGDTVIAAFSLGLAAGADFIDAARLSNLAGGIVVMKKGTATASREEIRTALLSLPTAKE